MNSSPQMLEKVSSLSLFSEFTTNEIETFLTLMELAVVPAGQCIVKQDEPGDCMYILISGSAKVIHRKDGKELHLATMKEGDFFGELALVDEGPRSADVEAVEEATLVRVPQSVIRAMAGVVPAAAFKLMVAVGRVLVERLRRGNQKYIDSLLIAAESAR
jgi:CRP-like cAMP-binding protein